jgi:hypothetical protein
MNWLTSSNRLAPFDTLLVFPVWSVNNHGHAMVCMGRAHGRCSYNEARWVVRQLAGVPARNAGQPTQRARGES